MGSDPLRLLGRRRESATLDRLLDAGRAGESRALILRGEAGVGKTALLDQMVESAPDFRVVRTAGVESEMELAFAAVQQLCAPLLDRLDRLPGPQRSALGTAFGLAAGDAPDRFLVGLAVLGLFAEAARDQPLLCVVDDAHWLDRESAQTLGFVGRRLLAQSVVLAFAVRTPTADLTGLPELMVEGLSDDDARALVTASALAGPLDDRVRDRIVAETGGNPLALLELPRGLTRAELAGGFGLPDALPLSLRIEESFRRRLEALPPDARRLLLVAAAEPLGEPVLVWRGAERLGIGFEAAKPAVAAGLVEFGSRVRFRHPLVRSAIYQAASPEERRVAHRVLAEATEPEVDADRRAWHRAHAADGPDEDVADELERSAGRAQARGGLAAAAAFLERSVSLTLDPGRRAGRALAAAQYKHLAGAPEAALKLLATAESAPLDELERTRVDLLRAQVVAASSHGRDAPPLLLAAARRLEPLDIELARATYLETLEAALFAGPLARAGGLLESAASARAAPASPEGPRPPDLLLDGLALLITEGYAAGAPTLERAVSAFRGADLSRAEGLRWLWLACMAAMDLWDDEAWEALSVRFAQLARDAGALAVVPMALSARVGILVYAGEVAAAASAIDELQAVTAAVGAELGPYAALALAAWQGREAHAIELIDANIDGVVKRGEGIGLGVIHWTRAFLHNSAGRYEAALAEAEQAGEYPATLLYARWSLVELVEAAAKSGQTDRAAAALARLSETTGPSGTDWALGIEARSRALVTDGEAADRLHRQAIDHLGRTRVRVELARTHLLYGEWLRGEGRRPDARRQLRTAQEMFTAMGIGAFADRVERGLQAAGEPARKRVADTSDELTAREAQVARLARDGLSNTEIGAQVFISARTVEYHLHKVFGKLAIRSRHELQGVLSTAGSVAAGPPAR